MVVALCAAVMGLAAPNARAQTSAPAGAPAAAPADEHVAAPAAHGETASAHAGDATAEGHGGGHEAASPWGFIGKIVNFAILVGAVFYFARQPFARYLADRGVQIRDDLVRASEMKADAGRQIAEIDAKLTLLPGELAALRARGRDEVTAEEARIDEAAAQERDRLLEQTRREIDLQLRTARRDLVTHAADLAVQVARERIRDRITTDDQARLVDRYLSQVRR